MRGFIRGLLLLSFVVAADLHLPLLQVCAWTGMTVHYARNENVMEALKDTFGGERPCKMCCAIRKARTEARKSLTAPPALEKIKATLCGHPPLFQYVAIAYDHPLPVLSGDRVPAEPDVPPPRACA
jgi:hypothetical protein